LTNPKEHQKKDDIVVINDSSVDCTLLLSPFALVCDFYDYVLIRDTQRPRQKLVEEYFKLRPQTINSVEINAARL